MIKYNFCKENFKTKNALTNHQKNCKYIMSIRNDIINSYANDFLSILDLVKKYKLCKDRICKIIKEVIRSKSNAMVIAHNRFPEKFFHSDETKEKMRIKRIEFMKAHPEQTAWRKTNLSYPEKLFQDEIINLKLHEKYAIEREYSIFPYYIDFAFLNEKIAVEIDGSQHLLLEKKESDNKKDQLLINNGWSVIRITENEIKTNLNVFITNLENILNSNHSEQKYSFGIFAKPKGYMKKRINNKMTEAEINSYIKQRRVERPPYEILLEEINELGYRGTGKKYNVSDKTIKKWVIFYEKYGIAGEN